MKLRRLGQAAAAFAVAGTVVVGLASPAWAPRVHSVHTKEECKDGRWQRFDPPFTNQGQCVATAQK